MHARRVDSQIAKQQDLYPVSVICRVLEVSLACF